MPVGSFGNPEVLREAPVSTSAGVVARIAGSVAVTGAGSADSENVTHSSVAASLSSTTMLAANSSRLRFSIFNDDTAALMYIHLDDSAATTTNQVAIIQPRGYFEPPVNYKGEVRAIWSAATGAARVAEYLP
jgi:hypothetical protein